MSNIQTEIDSFKYSRNATWKLRNDNHYVYTAVG